MQLQVNNLQKSFGDNHVLKGISFSAQSGLAFGLLGRNGSGKTTTIRIIMDIFAADEGSVTIDGSPVSHSKVKIGYLPEEKGLYPKRVIAEQMAYFGQLRGLNANDAKNRSEMLLSKLGAHEFYKRKLDTLSKGNQQKIQLAIALLNDPDIVILDEPFSGLDPVNAKTLKDLVTELVENGKMVLFSSHQMANVEEFCDDLCIINQGEIVLSGNLTQIKKGYARNKIFVSSATTDLYGILSSNAEIAALTDSLSQGRLGCTLALKRSDDKARLLGILAGKNIDLDSFKVVEPTLEEIFVEKAGVSNEEL